MPKRAAAVGAVSDSFDIFTAAIEALHVDGELAATLAGPEAFNGITTGGEPVIESFDLGGEQSGSWVISVLIFVVLRHSGSRFDWGSDGPPVWRFQFRPLSLAWWFPRRGGFPAPRLFDSVHLAARRGAPFHFVLSFPPPYLPAAAASISSTSLNR